MDQIDETARELVPWEESPGEDGPARHDGFNQQRKRAFLKELSRKGCVRDAAKKTGVNPATVYNHQARDAVFAQNCRLALDMAGADIELAAWERGVVGIEEEVIAYGKVVGTRVKRSDMILKMLLQGTMPDKYGPRAGFTRKRLTAQYREQIENEVRDEIANERDKKGKKALAIIRNRLRQKRVGTVRNRRAKGWTVLDYNTMIPPGWSYTGDPASYPGCEVDPIPEPENVPESM